MKKLVSLLLAMIMVTSLFTVAFAADPFTSFVGEDVELFHVTSLSIANVNDDPYGVDGQYLAQHFIPAEETVSGVSLRLKYGGGQGVMHFEIRKGDANGETVFTNDVEIVAKGNVANWYTFIFDQNATVIPGEKYALTFWFASKTTGDFCIAMGSYECNEGLDLWRHKRFEHSSNPDGTYGTLYEEKDLPLKETGRTVGFEILTPNKTVAMEVDAVIAALPRKITVHDEEAVNNALSAYEALTDAQKAYVMNFDLLNAAVDALAAAKAQYAIDTEAAGAFTQMVQALPQPQDVALVHQEQINAAKEAYSGLTKDQKALLDVAVTEKYNGVLVALKTAVDTKAVAEAEAMIEALPTPTDITVDDVEGIMVVLFVYEELTTDQKAMVNPALVEKLEQIAAVLEDWDKYSMGDVNADGKVDAKDALLVLKAAVQKAQLSYIQFLVADIDANDKTDAKDALEILKFSVEKPSLLDEFYAPVE